MSEVMRTEFAPAERADAATLARQRRLFGDAWFFGELLHYIPDMVMVLNGQRQIVYANRAVLEASGAESVEGVAGLRPGEAFRCRHATETDGGCGTTAFCRYCGAVRAVLASQRGTAGVEECRMIVERDAGEAALDLRVWANPVMVAGERFTFYVMGDIADEKRRHFLERIFLHDLTNTASALFGFSELLGTHPLAADQREEYTGIVGRLSERLLDEIAAHRQLVQAESGDLILDVRSVGSRALLEEVLGAFARAESLDSRRLELAADAADVVLETDRTLLRRVLGNMVKNAIEASAPGETVRMGCTVDGSGVSFWVRNPTYMPENIRLQVFNRSFSTKGAGRGLGTYSMKFLTETYLGGRIAFSSSEAEGTTFIAWYPQHRPAAGRRPASPAH